MSIAVEDKGSEFASNLLKRLGASAAKSSSASAPTPAASRPARLGLGAAPAKKTLASEISDKVAKQLNKVKKRKAADADEDNGTSNAGADDAAPEDSKVTAAVSKRKIVAQNPLDLVLTAKKKKKVESAPNAPAATSQTDPTLTAPPKSTVAHGDADASAFASNWDDGDFPSNWDAAAPSAAPEQPAAAGAPAASERKAEKKKKNNNTEARAGPSTEAQSAVLGASLSTPDADDKAAPDAAKQSAAAHRQPHGEPTADAPRKRKKIRSKQKNLRKDNRPEHLRPTYRTPGATNYVAPKPAWKGRPKDSDHAS